MRCAPDKVVTKAAGSDGRSARLARAQMSAGQEDRVHRSITTQAACLTLTQTTVGLLQPLKVGHFVLIIGVSGCTARWWVFSGHYRSSGRC